MGRKKLKWVKVEKSLVGESVSTCGRYRVWKQGLGPHNERAPEWAAERVGEKEWLFDVAATKIEAKQGCEEDLARRVESWSDEELAAVLLSQLWRWMDAGGKSGGRSYDAQMLESARDLLNLQIPVGGEVDARPPDTVLLEEAQRRKLTKLARRTA